MKRNNDKMLLESLVRKYGKNGVKNAIKNINESSNKETNMHNSPIYLCVDKDGAEKMYAEKYYMYNGPTRGIRSWRDKYAMMIFLPDGTINKLIGHDLTWDDEPFKYN